MALAPADPRATSSPPSRPARVSAIAGGRARLTTSRGGPSCGGASVAAGTMLRVSARCRERHRGRDNRPTDRERDVDRPIGASLLAELAGAIERIDDPHAFGAEPDGIVGTFLGEHRVVGTARR